MTQEQINFISRLNENDIKILESLINENKNEVLEYLKNLLQNSEIIKAEDLMKDIPITYLPVMGTSIDYYYNFGHLKTIYDYYSKNEIEKQKIRNLGISKMQILDCSVDFVLEFLNQKIELCRENKRYVLSGKILLDEELAEKKQLILIQAQNIYQYLSKSDVKHVFDGNKINYIEHLISEKDLKKQEKLVEILARYSHLEDLESHNIESFQKFIKK